MHWICSLPFSSRAWHLLRPWTGLFWDSSIRDPTIPGPSHSLQPVFLCPLTHKTRVRLGNWFSLCLTRTSLEPTDMGMQILAEFCVVLPPLSLCFLTAQFGEGRETRKQLALNVLELLSRDANSPLAGCCGSFWGCLAALLKSYCYSWLDEARPGCQDGFGGAAVTAQPRPRAAACGALLEGSA